MAAHGGPNIPTDQLALAIDAENDVSIPQVADLNILDYSTWTVGTGSATGFGRIGADGENHRILANDPFGNETVVWEARPDAVSGADGGWNGNYYSIDNSKMYRFSVWVKRNNNVNGRFYLGLSASGTQSGVNYRTNSGAGTTNPYFWHNVTSFTADVWYLIVGHVWPAGTGTGSLYADSGRYTVDGRVGNVSHDFIWKSGTTIARHRSYLYYGTDTDQRQQFVYPRIDLVDGTEPSISDLLNNRNYKIVISDMSRERNNSTSINGVQIVDNNERSFQFDGVDDYIDLGIGNGRNPSTDPITISLWVKPNSTTSQMFIATTSNGTNQRFYHALYSGKYDMGIQASAWGTGTASATVGEWAHYVCVMDGSTAKQYVNGELALSKSYTSYTFTSNLNIGRGGPSYHSDVDVSKVKVYEKALTEKQVKRLYTAHRKRYLI